MLRTQLNTLADRVETKTSRECGVCEMRLNMTWFLSPEDARDKVERWRRDYNEFRPHSALTYLTPAEFALRTGLKAV